jgi:cysteine desulfurase
VVIELRAYLDHAATTPVRPEALEAMLPLLRDGFGNPSGSHAIARRARKALDEAREDVADVLGCQPGEVVLTSGGTEADDLAVAGVLEATGGTAACSAAEHHAVLDAVTHAGGRVVAVDPAGAIDLDALAEALDPSVALVSAMLVNNEVGTWTDLAAVARVVAERAPSAVLHTDAVQGVAWFDVRAAAAPAHLVSVSGHKVGAPKGIGALVVRRGVELAPRLRGGGQERGRRSGTENVAGAVALAAALRATDAARAATVARVGALRDALVDGVVARASGVRETVDRARKVAGNAHLLLEGVESEAVLFLLDRAGVAASAASACASGAMDPSHVLAAMGVAKEDAAGALRLSLGTTTTEAEVAAATDALVDVLARLRG